MWSGILNETLDVYRFIKSGNAFGEEQVDQSIVGSYRCGTTHQSTSRTVINDEIQYPYQKKFIVRKYVDVKEDDWIKYDGKFYRILSIEFNRELQNKLIIVEVVNE